MTPRQIIRLLIFCWLLLVCLSLGRAAENTVRQATENPIQAGKAARGWLGVVLTNLDAALARQFNVPDSSGALVGGVAAGGPADKAGLKQGDVIRTFDSQKVDSTASLTTALTGTNPGTTVTFGILRDGKPEQVQVTLGERPPDQLPREPMLRLDPGRAPHGSDFTSPSG